MRSFVVSSKFLCSMSCLFLIVLLIFDIFDYRPIVTCHIIPRNNCSIESFLCFIPDKERRLAFLNIWVWTKTFCRFISPVSLPWYHLLIKLTFFNDLKNLKTAAEDGNSLAECCFYVLVLKYYVLQCLMSSCWENSKISFKHWSRERSPSVKT